MAGYFRRTKTVWTVANGEIASGGFAYAGTAGGGCILQRPIYRRTADHSESHASPKSQNRPLRLY